MGTIPNGSMEWNGGCGKCFWPFGLCQCRYAYQLALLVTTISSVLSGISVPRAYMFPTLQVQGGPNPLTSIVLLLENSLSRLELPFWSGVVICEPHVY